MTEITAPGPLTPLAQLFGALADERPLADRLNAILDTACASAHADTGTIGLYDPGTDAITASVTRHSMPATFATRFARGEGLAGHIIASGQRYLGRYGDLPHPVVNALREHQALGMPLLWQGRLLGYLALSLEPPRRFKPIDLEMAQVLTHAAAAVIENATLHEQAGSAAVLAERQRLARELHDNVTQILASINLLSQTIASTWKRDPAEGEARAARLQQLAQTAFAEMRMLLQQLTPAESAAAAPAISRKSRVLLSVENLRTLGLPGALTRLLASTVPEHIATASSFAAWEAQRDEHEQALYRVCQEAVSNCLRHAGARRLRVEAAVTGDHAVLRVSDDGRGLGMDFRPGIGLGSMRSRIEALHGSFRIGTNNPRGTLIEARLPRADRDPPRHATQP
ncbi:MAG: GAF domain-containing sensor histidine kinase [Rudaea sp.]